VPPRRPEPIGRLTKRLAAHCRWVRLPWVT
jgi:hypothetical protein